MKVQRTMVAALAVAWCSTAHAGLKHRYSFSGSADDSVGGAHGTVVDPGAPTAVYAGGKLDVSANNDNHSNNITEDAYVNFPNGIVTAATSGGAAGQLTVEVWAQSATNRNWAALFSAGTSNGGEDQSPAGNNADYIQLIPQNGQNQTIRATTHRMGVGAEGFVDYTSAMSTTQITHLAAVFDQSGGLPGTVTMYIDGGLVGSAPVAAGLDIGAMPDNNIWLGRSQWDDSVFDGIYDELRIYDGARTAAQVAQDFQLGADAIPEPTSALLAGSVGVALTALRRRAKR